MRTSILNYGTNVNSLEQARAALNYGIAKEEIFDQDGKSLGDFRGIFNTSTRRCLGIPKKGFTFIQPSESLEIMEAAVKASGARWKSVAATHGGGKLFAFAELPETKSIVAPKRGDVVSIGFGLSDCFTGASALSGDVFATVLACTNGAKGRKGLFNFFKKHTPSLSEVIAGIRFNFAVAVDSAVEDFRGVVNQLDTTPMTQAEHDTFTLRLFGVADETALRSETTPTRLQNRVDDVRALFVRGQGNVGRSRWDSFNAVTEYLDHGAATFRETEGVSRAENRFTSLVSGNAANLRAEAMELLLN